MTMRNDRIASDAVAVAPSDTGFVDFVGLYVGGAGNVAVQGEGGVTVLFTAPPVGSRIDMHITRVMSTNTTATLLVGFKA
jgi:hypothetical protein